MSKGFAFKQSLQLCNVSNVRIFLVFQLRTFKVGFSGPKTFRGFRETGPSACFALHGDPYETLLRSCELSLHLASTGRHYQHSTGKHYHGIAQLVDKLCVPI